MKKMIVCALCALCATTMYAQEVVQPVTAKAETIGAGKPVAWSIEAGIGLSGYAGEYSKGTESKFAYKFGLNLDAPFSGSEFGFRTGLSFVSKGGKLTETSQGIEVAITLNQLYFELPLMATYRIETAYEFKVMMGFGAYLAYGVAGKTSYSASGIEISHNTFGNSSTLGVSTVGLDRFDAGLSILIGLDWPHYFANLNVQNGLAQVAEDSPKNMSCFLSVGYKF
jgi:opacity protein-like surface antigen